MNIQDKIKEIKQRAAPVNYSTVSVNERGALTDSVTSMLDQRVLSGYLLTWNQKNMYGEKVIKGACAKSISDRGPMSNAKYKITFLWQHKQDDPLSLFAELKEDNYGLYFKTMPLDDVPSADRAIKQIRSGTLNQFSIGFDYVWSKIEYDEKDDSLVLLELDLFEGSIVTIGADAETYALRSKENIELLHDDTEDFIMTLPRSKQLEARTIFTRHKTLLNTQPFEQREKTLEGKKPHEAGLDYNYLLNNFKL